MANRISQIPVEVLKTGQAFNRVSQIVAEVLEEGGGDVEVTQLIVEAIVDPVEVPTINFVDPGVEVSDEFGVGPLIEGKSAPYGDAVAVTDQLGVSLTRHELIELSDSLVITDSFGVSLFPHKQIDFPSDTLVVTDELTAVAGPFAAEPGGVDLLIAHFFLDEGTERYSAHYVRHPDWSYDARILEYGQVNKSIPVPVGLVRISDGSITVADTDNAIRNALDLQTPYRRMVELKIGPEGGSLSLFGTVHVGEVIRVIALHGRTKILFRDITWRWITKPIPKLGVAENFANMHESVDEFFIPIIFGEVNTDAPLSEQGAIRTVLLDTTTNGYPVARHPVESVTVYRKLPAEEVFTVVSSGYSVVEIAQTIDGISYTITWVQFSSAQADGTEIRLDVDGMNERPTWGLFSALSGSGALRNPVDALINLLLIDEVEIRQDLFDASEFLVVRDKCTSLGYFCDGAVVDSFTPGEMISQLATNFGIDFYTTRFGKVAIALTIEPEGTLPELDDLLDIESASANQEWPIPHFNRFRYRYARNYATGELALEGVYDNEQDQLALVLPDELADDPNKKHIEEEPLELNFIRDSTVALDVVTQRSTWTDLESYRINLTVPLPQNYLDVELTKFVRISHHAGIPEGGWVREAFKLISMRVDAQKKRLNLTGIRRVAPPTTIVAGELLGGTVENNARFEPVVGPAGEFYTVLMDSAFKHMAGHYTEDYGETWTRVLYTTATTNNIESFDRHTVDDLFHVVTQESGGRVAYSRWNSTTRLWEVENYEVATPSYDFSGVAISWKTPSTHLVEIAYRSSSGCESVELNTLTLAISSARVWSTRTNAKPGRLIPISGDKLHHIFTFDQFTKGVFSFRKTLTRTMADTGSFVDTDTDRGILWHAINFPFGGWAIKGDNLFVLAQERFGKFYVYKIDISAGTLGSISKTVLGGLAVISHFGSWTALNFQGTIDLVGTQLHTLLGRVATLDSAAIYRFSTDDGVTWEEDPGDQAQPERSGRWLNTNGKFFLLQNKLWLAQVFGGENDTQQYWMLSKIERDHPITLSFTDFLALL